MTSQQIKKVAGERVVVDMGSYSKPKTFTSATGTARSFKPKISMDWKPIDETKGRDAKKGNEASVPPLKLGKLKGQLDTPKQYSYSTVRPSPRTPLRPINKSESGKNGYGSANRMDSVGKIRTPQTARLSKSGVKRVEFAGSVTERSKNSTSSISSTKLLGRLHRSLSAVSDKSETSKQTKPHSFFDVVCSVVANASGKAPSASAPRLKSTKMRDGIVPTQRGQSAGSRGLPSSRSGISESGDVKAPVTFLQHYQPLDKREEVPSVLILSRMKNLPKALVAKCGNNPCIRCVIPDLDSPEFELPGSQPTRMMRDAKFAIVDPEFFGPLLRHALRLEWVHCTSRDSAKIASHLAKVRADAIRKKMQSAVLRRRLADRQKHLIEQKTQLEQELSQVEPALQAARASMKSISKKHLDELRSFNNPPTLVQDCLHATFRMLASAQAADPTFGQLSWQEIRKITHKHGFIESVIQFDPASLLSAVRKRIVDDYLSQAEPEELKKAAYFSSKVAGHLHMWILAQMRYAEVLENVQPLRIEIATLEREIPEMEADLQHIDDLAREGMPKYVLTRIGGIEGQMVAEYCLGRIISHERNFAGMAKMQGDRRWQPPVCDRRPVESRLEKTNDEERTPSSPSRPQRGYFIRALTDITVGVIGLGEVGGFVARLCKLAGMKVIGLARRPRPVDRGFVGGRSESESARKGFKLPRIDKRNSSADLKTRTESNLRSTLTSAASLRSESDDPTRRPIAPDPRTGEWADECVTPDTGTFPERKGLTHLLSLSDYIVCCLPSTPDTQKLIDIDTLKSCKKSAILINVGAGSILSEDLVLSALDSRLISGCILDSFAETPLPSSSKLWTHSNVLISPNIAAISVKAMNEVVNVFAENLPRKQQGLSMLHSIDWQNWDWSGARSRWKLLSGRAK